MKKVELDQSDTENKVSEPKLNVYLTVEDLKMRASLLAYAKYKYAREVAHSAKVKRTCLSIFAIVRCKQFIKKLKAKVRKRRFEMSKESPQKSDRSYEKSMEEGSDNEN